MMKQIKSDLREYGSLIIVYFLIGMLSLLVLLFLLIFQKFKTQELAQFLYPLIALCFAAPFLFKLLNDLKRPADLHGAVLFILAGTSFFTSLLCGTLLKTGVLLEIHTEPLKTIVIRSCETGYYGGLMLGLIAVIFGLILLFQKMQTR